MFPGLVMLLLAIFVPGPCQGALVVNELLPDPDGSDGGREFVELLNTGPGPVSLDGVLLQFGNGADGAAWLTRWTGTAGLALAPEGRYLIVDRNWQDEPGGDAEVYLGLQNGPDAVRLVKGEQVLDLVGYGPLTDPDMMEGAAAEIGSGRSLSRRPDGRDTHNNRNDFVLAEPTPGRANFLPFAVAVEDWELDPPSLDRAGETVGLTIRLRNVGTETLPAGSIVLRVSGTDHVSLLDRIPADQERVFIWNFRPLAEGMTPLDILVPLAGENDTLRAAPASLQVGPGRVVLNEALAVPRHGQGEWVELAAGSDRAVNLAGHALRDEEGGWLALPAIDLEPGDFLVLAQDSVALAAWHRDNAVNGLASACTVAMATALQRNLAGWPSLNNTPPEGRNFADRLYLAGPSGTVIDHLTIGGPAARIGGESEPGVSLERLSPRPRNPGAANWAPCTSPAGSTPGCPNSVASFGTISPDLDIRPRILDPEQGVTAVHILFSLTDGQAGWELRVFDLWGAPVRDLGGEFLGPGPRDLLWDGRDDRGQAAGAGAYLVLLECLDQEHRRLALAKQVMVIR